MNLINWAMTHGGQRSVAVGALGLRLRLYRGEGQSPGNAVEGLVVRSTRYDEEPLYHAQTGIYGFLRLPAGDHRLHVEDPLGRFLPRVLSIENLPDTKVSRRELRAGLDRSEDTPLLTFHIYPGRGYPASRADAIVWGRILENGTHRPIPFARVSIDGPTTVVGYSDLTGHYLLRLPQERSTIVTTGGVTEVKTKFNRYITPNRLRNEPRPKEKDPLQRFPKQFENLLPGAFDFNTEFLPSGVSQRVTIQIGGRVRQNILLP